MAVEEVTGPTYNTDGGERFPLPGLKSKDEFWVKVDKDTGNIQIFQSQPGIVLDKEVGTLNPKTGEIDFNEKWGGATKEQKEVLSDPNSAARKTIIDQAGNVVVQDEIKKCNGDEECITKARKIANEKVGNDGGLINKDILQQDGQKELKKGTEDRQGTRRSFGDWHYPETLRESDQDYIMFSILKYVPKGFKARQYSLDFFDDRGPLAQRKPVGSIILPIPANITDSNAVDWGEDSMNAVQAALSNIGMEFLTGGDTMGAITNTASGVAMNKDVLKTALGSAVVEAATGGKGGSLLTRSTGSIMNPNMELLFKKPQLRPFEFTYKLAPRSRKEAMQVIKIIRSFKQSMAAIRSASNLFLRTPHTYKLQYKHKSKAHPYLNMFKECALTNMTVNYTPDGNYATYEDGVMTAYEMKLSFMEIEPVFNDNYEISDDGTESAVSNFVSIAPGSASEVPASIGF